MDNYRDATWQEMLNYLHGYRKIDHRSDSEREAERLDRIERTLEFMLAKLCGPPISRQIQPYYRPE